MSATEEIKFRVSPDEKRTLQQAAAMSGITVKEFVCRPAIDRGRELVAEHSLPQVTMMAPASFDALMASLDEADELNERLVSAFRDVSRSSDWDLD